MPPHCHVIRHIIIIYSYFFLQKKKYKQIIDFTYSCLSVLTSIYIYIYIYFFFISNFPIIFLHSLIFLNIYTFFILSSSLTFSSPHYLYFNIAIHLSFHLPLFVSSYPFPLTINLSLFSILCIVFSHKKDLSLSLSLSMFWCIFIFYCISALG